MRGLAIGFCVALAGFLLGLAAALLVGAAQIFRLPALDLAVHRAVFIARYVFGFLRSLGGGGFQSLVVSIGVGIFLNNCMVAAMILLSPIPILKAKPFSDKYLGRLYRRYGVWLFKPIGWRAYRVLAAILPLYALALQFYLIGGVLPSAGAELSGMPFLALELPAVVAACLIAIQPSMSSEPLEELPSYIRRVKISAPVILATLFLAAILEAYQLMAFAA